MASYKYKDFYPKLEPGVFVAPSASLIGNVSIGRQSSVWYNCTIRGDVCYITIGNNSNIQDSTVIHVDRHGTPTLIGSGVTIGHSCLLHACTISDNSFVGMGSIVMDGSVLEPYSMLAAGSLLTPCKTVKRGEIWAGSPAKFFRMMTDKEIENIEISAKNYVELSKQAIYDSDISI